MSLVEIAKLFRWKDDFMSLKWILLFLKEGLKESLKEGMNYLIWKWFSYENYYLCFQCSQSSMHSSPQFC